MYSQWETIYSHSQWEVDDHVILVGTGNYVFPVGNYTFTFPMGSWWSCHPSAALGTGNYVFPVGKYVYEVGDIHKLYKNFYKFSKKNFSRNQKKIFFSKSFPPAELLPGDIITHITQFWKVRPKACFTPLVFSTTGGMGGEAEKFFKHLARKISTKKNQRELHQGQARTAECRTAAKPTLPFC